ncbi:IreB family regulatory phosphoprotein [Weissella halotolerans]|nr:IreB family regulatory phosphoprotein [Weissella halotolerans]
MTSLDHTTVFSLNRNEDHDVRKMLETVYAALEEKGYNPIDQIVGYLISNDPAYIPRVNDARNLIRKFERDEIIEALVKYYLGK